MIYINIKNNPNEPKFGLLLKMIYGICIEALNLWINLWLLKGFPNGPLPIAMNRLYWQDTLNFSVFHQTHNEALSVLVKLPNKGIFYFQYQEGMPSNWKLYILLALVLYILLPRYLLAITWRERTQKMF